MRMADRDGGGGGGGHAVAAALRDHASIRPSPKDLRRVNRAVNIRDTAETKV